MELEIDEYIRTSKGVIGKVIHIYHYRTSTHYLIDWNTPRPTCISQIKNIKHSKNIIDLIEVGDYVNGKKIECMNNSIFNANGSPCSIPQYEDEFGNLIDYNESEIEDIVTKEQFENNIYRVGE